LKRKKESQEKKQNEEKLAREMFGDDLDVEEI